MMLRCLKCVSQSVLGLMLVLLTQGCKSANPMLDTFTHVLPMSVQVASLTPGFEYLLVSVGGKASVMALGSRVTRDDAVHEHWYNGQGEMLYLVNGRVQQALGLTHELRRQMGTPPTWADLKRADKGVQWRRELDLMPGYRMGVTERVASRVVTEPSRLPEGAPRHAQWFEDAVTGKKTNGSPWIYEQRYALVEGRVVYSEQCLAPALCLTLRPLGVVVP